MFALAGQESSDDEVKSIAYPGEITFLQLEWEWCQYKLVLGRGNLLTSASPWLVPTFVALQNFRHQALTALLDALFEEHLSLLRHLSIRGLCILDLLLNGRKMLLKELWPKQAYRQENPHVTR